MSAQTPLPSREPTDLIESGPSWDHASWNGAMLVGPRGSLWGVRFGYIADDGQYISD